MNKVLRLASHQAKSIGWRGCARILAVAGVAALAGCIMPTDTGDPGDLTANPDYSTGYNDGCATANSAVAGFDETITRNENMFDNSQAYRAGWKSGHSSCGSSSTQRDPDVFGGEDRWYESGTIGSPN